MWCMKNTKYQTITGSGEVRICGHCLRKLTEILCPLSVGQTAPEFYNGAMHAAHKIQVLISSSRRGNQF